MPTHRRCVGRIDANADSNSPAPPIPQESVQLLQQPTG